MGTPKEDPKDKAARERERRMTELDRARAAQKEAAGLTTDLRSVYGLRSMSLFGTPGVPMGPSTGFIPPFSFGGVPTRTGKQ